MIADAREVDNEIAAAHLHLNVDRNALADIDAIVIEKARHLVDAIRHSKNGSLGCLLRLAPHGGDGGEQEVFTMTRYKLFEKLLAFHAPGILSGDIA